MNVNRRQLLGTAGTAVAIPGRLWRTAEQPSKAAGSWLADLDDSLVHVDVATLTIRRLGVARPARVVSLPTGEVLVMDAGNQWWVLDLVSGHAEEIQPGAARALTWQLEWTDRLRPATWSVERLSTGDGTCVQVRDNATNDLLLAYQFPRRIEVAASAVSPSRRWVAFVQGGNRASDLTVLDAERRRISTARFWHGAELAPYAITVHFSPDERALVASMTRAPEGHPETWTVSLADMVETRVGPEVGMVLAWLPGVGRVGGRG